MHPSLAETKQAVFWVDQLDSTTEEPFALTGSKEVDLVIIGGGFTGSVSYTHLTLPTKA